MPPEAVPAWADERTATQKPVTLTAWWHGTPFIPPVPGEFLRSELRPRGAYLLRQVKRLSDDPDDGCPRFKLICRRVRLDQVPADAKVWTWRWAPRRRRSRPLAALGRQDSG